MSRLEFVSLAGLRVDGRRPNEVRRIRARLGVLPRTDGSAYFEQGNTKVIAIVHGPREVIRRSAARHDKALLQCEYVVAPFSTSERKHRRAGDRKNIEKSVLVKQTLDSAVCLHLYPRSQIDIHINVLQSDGGELCAAINAATLALIDAGVGLTDFIVACGAGYIQKQALLDVNYTELSANGPQMPVAIMPHSKQIVMLEVESRIPVAVFEEVMNLAVSGCEQIHQILSALVKERVRKLFVLRGDFHAADEPKSLTAPGPAGDEDGDDDEAMAVDE